MSERVRASRYSSVVEHRPSKSGVLGSIPSGGCIITFLIYTHLSSSPFASSQSIASVRFIAAPLSSLHHLHDILTPPSAATSTFAGQVHLPLFPPPKDVCRLSRGSYHQEDEERDILSELRSHSSSDTRTRALRYTALSSLSPSATSTRSFTRPQR